MLRQHRLATSLLLPFRKPIAPVADLAKPRAAPELPAIHRYRHSAKNADKAAASYRGWDLDHAKFPTKGGAIFPRWPAMIHRADRVYHERQQHFPAPTFPRIRDKARSKSPAQACPLNLPARRRRTVCLLSW